MADDAMTVGFEDSVTVPEEMLTEGMPTKLTLTADDGVTVATLDKVRVPEEIGNATPAVRLPICITWRWTPPPWSIVSTIVADEGVAGTELWNGTLLAMAPRY